VAGLENPLWLGLLNVGSVRVKVGLESPMRSRLLDVGSVAGSEEERIVGAPEITVGLGLLNVGIVRSV
jgi:hypothetical protein